MRVVIAACILVAFCSNASAQYHRQVPQFHYQPQYHMPPVQHYQPQQNYQQHYNNNGGGGMRPAVVVPNQHYPSHPGIINTRLPSEQIPRYRQARWSGGTFVAGAGAYYYLNTDTSIALAPSGSNNTGAPFDIEAFVRALLDDGSAPGGNPDGFNGADAGELVPED